jgi:hypothetical protein
MPGQRPATSAARRQAGGTLLPGSLFAFMLVYLAVPFGSIFAPAGQAAANDMSANAASRFIKLALLGIAIVLMMRHVALLKRLLKRVNVFFLAFLILVPLSYLWSISPPNTLARYVSVVCIVGLCLAFCTDGWHPLRFQNVVRPTVTALLGASVIFVFYDPRLGIEQGTGTLHNAWEGLLGQKNPFGDLASFGAIFWLHGLLWREVKPWKAIAGGGVAGFCLLMSRSSTSLLATLFASMFMVMGLRPSPALKRYMPYFVSVFAVVVVVYAMAVLQLIPGADLLLKPIMMFTGKDMTFSNRSVIWEIIREHIALSPLLGSGYGAYWIGPVPSSPSFVFLSRMYFYPTESHNGYIEIVNDLGYVGLLCLGGYLYMYVRQSLQLLRLNRAQGMLFLALFFQQAFINLSESCWLAIDSGYIFMIMALATFALARALIDRQQPAGAAPSVAHQSQHGPRRRPQILGPRPWLRK